VRYRKQVGLVCLCAVVAGCDKVAELAGGSDGWKLTTTQSAFDGETLVASRSFLKENVPTFMTVEIVCMRGSGDLKMVVESYMTEAQGESQPASELVLAANGSPLGRVKTAGDPETYDAGNFFELDGYTNVARWPIGITTLVERMIEDQNWYQQWYTAVAISDDGLGLDAWSDFAAIAQGNQGAVYQRVYNAALRKGRVGDLRLGQKVMEYLPLMIELKNSGGTFELVVPADDKAVQQVLAACAGNAPETQANASAPGSGRVADMQEELIPETPQPELTAGLETTQPQLTAGLETAAVAAKAVRWSDDMPLPAGVTLTMVTQGERIFYVHACHTCHRQDGRGGPLGPALNDHEWLHAEGLSYEQILRVVTNGVGSPKKHPDPMLPSGGATLSENELRAVAAYVYALSL
jgi:mono/diheme cytochrome c family protein